MFLPSTSRRVISDPFLDFSSLAIPSQADHQRVADLCERLWVRDGTYKMAAGRISRYFITKLKYKGIGEAQREKLDFFFQSRFRIVDRLALRGDDMMCYGTSLASILMPFRRFLICEACGAESSIDHANWKFENWTFQAICPRCKGGYRRHRHDDRRSMEESRINMVRWQPQRMYIAHHPLSADEEYYWDPQPRFAQDIRRHVKFVIQHTPWEIIEAVRDRRHFKFAPGIVHSMREEALAGIDTNGWGMSRMLSTMAQTVYARVLKRANEVLAADYSIPVRVVSPMGRSSNADPSVVGNMADIRRNLMTMLQNHKRDPGGWHMVPFPLDYRALGAEGKMLATPDLIANAVDDQLSAIGMPPELYKASLQVQAAPMALRLFQQSWPHLVSGYNSFLEHAADVICPAMGWARPESVSLEPPTLADDLELKQVMLQLASSGVISKGTAFSPYNIDVIDEFRKIMQETSKQKQLEQEAAEDEQQQQMAKQYLAQLSAGQPAGAPQGQPMPAVGQPAQAPAGASTPQQRLEDAEERARQLARMPESARRRELRNIAKTDETLHALVIAKLEDERTMAEGAGRDMLSSGQM